MKSRLVYIVLIAAGTVLGACKGSRSDKPADTVKKDSILKKYTTHLLGMWLDEEIKTDNGEQVAYQIVTQGPKTYIQVITFKEKKLNVDDNPTIAPSASAIKKSGNNKYVSVDNANEIYMIEKTGDLLIYDKTGFIAKCKKLL